MIVLFDCNSYDELAELMDKDPKTLKEILDKIEKFILPQAVRKQIDMMIEREDKMAKLPKINQIIANLDIAGKVVHVDGIFGFVLSSDLENGEIKKDKITQRKYYSATGFSLSSTFNKKSLGINNCEKQRYFESLPGKMKNGDKQIALTAKQESAILVTNDLNIIKGLSTIEQSVFSFKEFKNFILPKSNLDH